MLVLWKVKPAGGGWLADMYECAADSFYSVVCKRILQTWCTWTDLHWN